MLIRSHGTKILIIRNCVLFWHKRSRQMNQVPNLQIFLIFRVKNEYILLSQFVLICTSQKWLKWLKIDKIYILRQSQDGHNLCVNPSCKWRYSSKWFLRSYLKYTFFSKWTLIRKWKIWANIIYIYYKMTGIISVFST